MEQVLSIAMLALAIALLAVLMRAYSRLSEPGYDPEGDTGRSVHEIAIPVRVAIALVTLPVLIRAAEVAQGSSQGVVLGIVLLPALAWINAFAWQFRATLSGDDLTVMAPNFRVHRYDLSRLVEVQDAVPGTLCLRFQGGEACWLLKYLSGRNILRQALTEAQPYY